MSTPKEAYERLRSVPSLHSTALLYDTLLREAYRGSEGRSNGEIAKLLGLSHEVVLRHLRILRLLGLVVPVQKQKRKGYDLIFVLADVSNEQMQVLDAVSARQVSVNLRNGLMVCTGQKIDLSEPAEQLLATTLGSSRTPSRDYPQVDAEDLATTPRSTRQAGNDPQVDASGHSQRPQGRRESLATTPGSTRKSGDDPRVATSGVFFLARAVVKDAISSLDHSSNYDHSSNCDNNQDFKQQQQHDAREETRPDDAVVGSTDKPGGTPSGRRKKQKDPEVEAAVERVLEAWKIAMDYPKARLTTHRRGIVRARLQEGYTEDDLLVILAWAKDNEFLRGKNARNRAYDGVDTLFRSADRVEDYLVQATQDTRRKANSRALMPLPPGTTPKGWNF